MSFLSKRPADYLAPFQIYQFYHIPGTIIKILIFYRFGWSDMWFYKEHSGANE